MRKIPTLFQRTEDRRYVIDKVTPGCEWVLTGAGIATRKYDGTCVMIDKVGRAWARREVKPGKNAPPEFVEVEHDETTGKTVGWVPYETSSFRQFVDEATGGDLDGYEPGTYELCGPKINGNPEGYDEHKLIRHGRTLLAPPISFAGLRLYLLGHDYEGIVWHHPDGRMAKLKRRDFAPRRDNEPGG